MLTAHNGLCVADYLKIICGAVACLWKAVGNLSIMLNYIRRYLTRHQCAPVFNIFSNELSCVKNPRYRMLQ